MKKRLTQILAFFKERDIKPAGLILWLLAFAAVVVAVIGFGSMSARQDQVFPVYITEVVASNTSYPNADGRCCDYIEIYNSANYAVDLSGFQMGDIAGKSRYAFPADTVLEPGAYMAVYCDKTATGSAYAPFEINRSGGETFYLIAQSGAVVDSVTSIPMDVDQSMVLQADGQWAVSELVTPGRANELVTAGDQNIYNPAVSPVRLSEFSAADTGYLAGYGVLCDWVELYNTAAEPVDISGFVLSDNVGNDKYTFPEGTVLEGNSRLVVYCTDRVADEHVAPFHLSRQNEEVIVFKDGAGMIVEIVRSGPMEAGTMALGADGLWTVTNMPSPGYENTEQGHRAFLEQIGAEAGSVRISEVMSGEQLVLADAFGEFSDWVELYNTTERPIDLAGWCLSDDPAEPQKWMIPELVLQPGERKVIFCSGCEQSVSDELHAGFALSAGGESLTLTSYLGGAVDTVSFPEAVDHCSFVFAEDGQTVKTDQPTPGYMNNDAGFEAFCTAAIPEGPLAIWEVMTSNDQYLPQRLGRCYDWVELKNISGEPLDLSGFSITDDADVPRMHQLEAVTLQPGKRIIVILSDEAGAAKDGMDQALFSLDAQSDRLFIYDEAGNLVDYVRLADIPPGRSYGRSEEAGGFYYMEPSPGNPNYAGYRLISSAPVSSYVPGVYSQEEGFCVTLEADGAIYYTTDGSEPDAGAARYKDTLRINETTVLRAVSVEEGKLTSDIYTATFIVGEAHDLPVVSLVTDPAGLWGYEGVYRNGDSSVKEVRLPAHVSYSGADGSFAMDCQTNLHGATTVVAFPKKSFALRFEDSYGGPLNYDVFEDGEVTAFSSLILRNAYESTYSSQMHDAMIGYIASQSSDTVLSQKYKYVAMYLNGEYWGLYAIRERHSQEHYASYMDVPADTVSIVRFAIDAENSLHELYDFCARSTLRTDENYAYAKTVIDVESFADWIIFEAYMCNVDINSNIRYYQSSVDGLWRMGLADVDLGIVGSSKAFDEVASTFHHGRLVRYLMNNEDFQDLLATRLAELLAGPLSDENVLATIDKMANTIRSEIPRDAARWGYPASGWEWTVTDMKNFCDGRAQEMIDSLCAQLGFSAEEREAYFGHLE